MVRINCTIHNSILVDLRYLSYVTHLFSFQKVKMSDIFMNSIRHTETRKFYLDFIQSVLRSYNLMFSDTRRIMPVTETHEPLCVNWIPIRWVINWTNIIFNPKTWKFTFTIPLWINLQKPLLEIWTWFEVRWKAESLGFPTHTELWSYLSSRPLKSHSYTSSRFQFKSFFNARM